MSFRQDLGNHYAYRICADKVEYHCFDACGTRPGMGVNISEGQIALAIVSPQAVILAHSSMENLNERTEQTWKLYHEKSILFPNGQTWLVGDELFLDKFGFLPGKNQKPRVELRENLNYLYIRKDSKTDSLHYQCLPGAEFKFK